MPQSNSQIFGKKYQIIEQIGHGGFATVYRAVDTTLDREVAVKILDSMLLRDKTFLERFRREAKIIARLNHPNIIAVYEIGEDQGQHYIVMPYIAGASLYERIKEQGGLDPDWVANLAKQISAALDYAHQQDLIHRDIKPANILLDNQDNALLTDFGIAKAITEGTALTRTGTQFGSPPYMAPEQWTGQVDKRADIYSLGIMLYELLTGQTPFIGETSRIMFAHVHEPPPSIRTLNPSLSSTVEQVLQKALAKDPNQRYQTAGHLASDLQMAISGQSVQVNISSGNQPQTKKQFWPIYAVIAVITALVIVVALRVFNQNSQARTSVAVEATTPAPTPTLTLTNTPPATIVKNQFTPTTDYKAIATAGSKATSTAQALVVATHRARNEATKQAQSTATARTARSRATFTAVANATAQAKVAVAPTAAPVTSLSGLLPGPQILGPDNEKIFEDPYQTTQITLSWEPIKATLGPDEYYLITIPYKHQGQTWIDYGWTQQTSWTVSDHKYLLDISDDGLFTWSVALIQQTETDTNGVPQGPALSEASKKQTFYWRAPLPSVFESPVK